MSAPERLQAAQDIGQRVRDTPPAVVAVVVGVLALGVVVSIVKKLLVLAVILAVAAGVYLAYRSGAFSGATTAAP